MFDANPAVRHMVRLDGRVTRCGRKPPERRSGATAGLDMCPDCRPGKDLPDAARSAHAVALPTLQSKNRIGRPDLVVVKS